MYGDGRTPWDAHFLHAHANIRVPVIPFKTVVFSRTHGHVGDKLTEAIHIAEESPSLNTDSGWQPLQSEQKLKLHLHESYVIVVAVTSCYEQFIHT